MKLVILPSLSSLCQAMCHRVEESLFTPAATAVQRNGVLSEGGSVLLLYGLHSSSSGGSFK